MEIKKKNTSTKKDNSKEKMSTPKMPKTIFGNVFFYVFVVFALYLVFGAFVQQGLSDEKKPISTLVTLINEEKVRDVVVSGDRIEVMQKDGTKFVTDKEGSISFDQLLANNNIDRSKISGKIEIQHRVTADQILSPVLMFGLPLLIVFLIFRQMKNAGGDILSFGKSRAKLFSKEMSKITFEDVAGNEEAKVEMKEIVDFLKNSEKYRKLGARIPKGVLLIGPSGVGKTLLARAIAGEANVPFFSVAGSEFMEMLVGVGSARARDLFAMAKQSQPSLIFIDEIDAIGRQRGMGIGGGHDEREQTLNQILVEMDGFDTRTDVIVLAATNRPDMLDPALVRAGRFDRTITIPLPDLEDRKEILKIHMRGKPFSQDVSVDNVAKKTVGFSGADIENMLNESAILAARNERQEIFPSDVEEAALKVTMGSERRTLQNDQEKKVVAYHEAGHALVSSNVEDMDAVHRVSIIARGGSLGHTSFPPERDRYNETKTRLMSMVVTMLGGRAAEEIIFNEMTVGAASDIQKATSLVRKMITEYGMSSLGPVSLDGKGDNPWLAREMGQSNSYSEETASLIDIEVKKTLNSALDKAKNILTQKKEMLDRIAQRLLEKETIDSDEYLSLLDSK